MDQGGLNLEPEVIEVLKHVAAGRNFLLSGGAGSGKTYSLVQVIGELLRTDPSAFVACITFTNAAVREVESRISNERLTVRTIHDFLWDVVSPFQQELRKVLVELLSGDEPKLEPGTVVVSGNMFAGKKVQYKEFTRVGDGIVSHDEVIIIAHAMFETYPKIRDILRDRYRYILVDEYQDTAPEVVKILLDWLPLSSRQGLCGFFGDAMQSIYDEGVGSIQPYVVAGTVDEVRKQQNRRNPRLVFELANNLRTDGIVQGASKDLNAPNMIQGKVKDGVIRFYHSTGDDSRLQKVRDQLGWDFSDVLETKELNLTHNLIAPQAGFGDLMEIYDKDRVLAFRNRIVKFIKTNGNLNDYQSETFGKVVASLQKGKTGNALRAVSPTAGMQAFIDANPKLLEYANEIEFHQFRRLYVDKDQLIDDKKHTEEEITRKGSKRCDFVKHVFKIQSVVHLYEQRRFNEFLRKTEFRLTNAQDKLRIQKCVEDIGTMKDSPILDVIDFAHDNGLCIKDDKFANFRAEKRYLFDRLIGVAFSSFQKLYEYLEGRTTFSTQHKIKGREFERVLVLLDAGEWNHYNFTYLFEGSGTDSVIERTGKLFYVCCTRAKDVLAVYFQNPTPAVLKQAEAWFGKENVVEV
ncbi:DNA/RNA helicase [Rhizobium sp. Root73]|uniref:UvrD-helicase domain-containing protein n=1 Tax=unclassified Rhizobium TaxID=2613769 RepID=UPI000723EBF0|nr:MULTISPECIES: ATP-dependent helicase [unclassified Rhizobium]KQY03697.1 DNA/RNA helicase [Rhizobium sp. Root1334]KRC00337.1 DNA/RNA helicase [Rhizobium sp. Root73]